MSSMSTCLLGWGVQKGTWHSSCGLIRSGQGLERAKDHLPRPGNALCNALQGSTHPVYHKSMLLAHVQLGVHQEPQVFFPNCFLVVPRMYWWLGLFLHRCRTLNFPFLNSMKFLSAHLSSLLKTFWMAAEFSSISDTPHKFVSSMDLLGYTAPSSRSLMKKLNRTGCSIEPSLHCYLMASNQTLYHLSLGLNIHPVSIQLIVCSSKPILYHLCLWGSSADSVKSLTGVQGDNLYHSSLI